MSDSSAKRQEKRGRPSVKTSPGVEEVKKPIMVKVAINGFGRIGRNAFRAYLANPSKEIEIVAINDPMQDLKQSAYLLKYDSIAGELPFEVTHTQDSLVVDGKTILFSREREPGSCPWAKLKVDIVLECSGVFTDADKAQAHITAGRQESVDICSSQRRRHHNRFRCQ